MKAASANFKTTTEDYIDAYAEMISQKHKEGWRLYLFGFLFRPLPGTPEHRLATMEKELMRIYAAMVTRIVRRPRSLSAQKDMPRWIAFPDFPVPKNSKKDDIVDLIPNDGLHMHAIVAIPPTSRTPNILRHIRQYQWLYLGKHRQLAKITAKRIRRTPKTAARYVLKSLSRRRWGEGLVLLLPRSVSELSD